MSHPVLPAPQPRMPLHTLEIDGAAIRRNYPQFAGWSGGGAAVLPGGKPGS